MRVKQDRPKESYRNKAPKNIFLFTLLFSIIFFLFVQPSNLRPKYFFFLFALDGEWVPYSPPEFYPGAVTPYSCSTDNQLRAT